MRSRSLRDLSVHFSAYLLSGILNAAIPFLLLPVLTRYLTPEAFGLLAVFQATVALMTPLCLLNTPGAISVAYFHITLRETLASYIFSCLVLPVLAAGGVFGILWLGARAGFELAQIAPELAVFVPVFCLLQLVPAIVLSVLQASQSPLKYGA